MSKVFTRIITATTLAALAGTAVAVPVVARPEGKRTERVATAKKAPKVVSQAPMRATDQTFIPTFAPNFYNEADFNLFSIIDANRDGYTWQFLYGYASYSYHKTNTANDWLITPGLNLKAGKEYTFSMEVRVKSPNYGESFEVKMGSQATAAGMTTQLISRKDINNGAWQTYTVKVTAPADGVYYIGILCCSYKDRDQLHVRNIKLEAPANTAIPNVPTEVSAVADEAGALSATVNFTAPSTDIGGANLSELTAAIVTRADGTEVGRIDNPTPGATYSVVDNSPAAGDNTYNVKVVNSDGESKSVTTWVFVGFTAPAQVTNLKAVETSEGVVTLTWDPVTKDQNGKTLPEGSVKYIVNEYYSPIATGLTECTHTYTAQQPGEQAVMRWNVVATTDKGNSWESYSESVVVGTPYTVPYVESAPNGEFSKINTEYYPNRYDQCYTSPTDDNIAGIPSQDGDNGMYRFYMSYPYPGSQGGYLSGKIQLPADQPCMLSYYVYGTGADNRNTVNAAIVNGDGTTTEVATGTANGNGWTRVVADLSAYAGQTIRLAIYGTIQNQGKVFADNVRIEPAVQNDLTAVALTTATDIQANEPIVANVKVENKGLNTVDAYSVDLYVNGVLVQTLQGNALAGGANETLSFSVPTSPLTPDLCTLYAVVNYEADSNTADNTTPTVEVAVYKTDLPAPFAVEHTESNAAEGSDVVLTWAECQDVAPEPVEVTEDFENAAPFSQEVAGWTMIDVDRKNCYVEFSNKLTSNVPYSFVVLNYPTIKSTAYSRYTPHSGDKCLISFDAYDTSNTVDDWAISPLLSGGEQTIGFWASSVVNGQKEKVEVYYTTTESTDRADFVKLGSFGTTDVPFGWNLYQANLPEGAKRFALRACTTGKTALIIDDVTFSVQSEPIALLGYNVYRDGEKLNTELVTTPSYTDAGVAAGQHRYNVTAVYSKGESRPSENYAVTGLENLRTNDADVEYYNLQGVRVAQPSNGVYIKRQGNVTTKVIVRK